MPINRSRASQVIKNFDFKNLFIEEMGWNNPSSKQLLPVQVDGQNYALQPLAEKVGMVVLNCALPKMPDRTTRRQIDREVTKRHYEHLIVFSDSAKTSQVWQWVRREAGKPEACRDYTFSKSNPSGMEGLLQKLDAISFSLEEEEELNTVVVASRVKKGFDVETVTKKFYERFDKERKAFLAFIQGIPGQASKEWYASLMLNRLMFVYFIQKKGFLAGDPDYLRNRLKMVQTRQGKGKFHSFYREFLLVLFHHGLGGQQRDPQLVQLLGQVPYLNGGLFDVHELERNNPKIEIPDEAFEGVFSFFDAYQWHLDERPLRRNDEINPDVLGYIFEKYINQKQMGAYYTKEDITEYISKNTILPFLFDKAQDKCEIAFEPSGTVWRLLQNDPDRYIYPAVKHGVDLPLPAEIESGVNVVARREGWNRPAPENYALPTEIWREMVARRKRYAEVRAKLAAGEVASINDLITYNLDIRQFAHDVIENCEGSNLLEAFYSAIAQVTVLDPTCGSGAFLFAALNILDPLYEACLERMQDFVDEADQGKPNPAKYAGFRQILQEVARHPNRRYFILRSIILQNLYGVDIMEEAVEIAKLRLFLKLAAQVECDQSKPNFGLEPLPDIDFNIRAGNTLVGFATQVETNTAIDRKFDFDGAKDRINQKAQEVARGYQFFSQLQKTLDTSGVNMREAKQSLRTNLDELRAELDRWLAGEYGIDQLHLTRKQDYEKGLMQWRQSHEPFHWWVEFYSIMHNGGFDVIIGNPPYVEYSKIKNVYRIIDYKTESCGNLYAYVMERSITLQTLEARCGLIIPISVICTDRTAILQQLLRNAGIGWYANFDTIPGRLFGKEVEQRLSVSLQWRNPANKITHTTLYQRFMPRQRDNIFELLGYQDVSQFFQLGWIPRVSANEGVKILSKLGTIRLENFKALRQPSPIYIHRIIGYYTKAFDFVPHFKNARDGVKKSEDYKEFPISEKYRKATLALVNSGLFYWYWHSHSDGFHCGYRDVWMFPINFENMKQPILDSLNRLSTRLMNNLKTNSEIKIRVFKATGIAELQEFDVAKAKPIIDEIDRVLAQHYGFTDEELDFIINYDIKYRMGRDSGEGEE